MAKKYPNNSRLQDLVNKLLELENNHMWEDILGRLKEVVQRTTNLHHRTIPQCNS